MHNTFKATNTKSRAESYEIDLQTARRRIPSIARRHTVVTRRMFESKIAEAGRFNIRVQPQVINSVINLMIRQGELSVEHLNGNLGELLYLPTAHPDAVATRIVEVTKLLTEFRRFSSGRPNKTSVLGKRGEDMIQRAFIQSRTMNVLHWGDINQYRGVMLDQPSDGLVQIHPNGPGTYTADHVALVEIKNRREWPYPQHYMLWKLIRNAYKLDVVGIYFSRRIPSTTFSHVFKRVGAIGIETYKQFAPPDTESALTSVKHKCGLGYHDLYFKDEVPAQLQRRIDDDLPSMVLQAHNRMRAVRSVVEPYLETLADACITSHERQKAYAALDNDLKAFDAASATIRPVLKIPKRMSTGVRAVENYDVRMPGLAG